VIATREDIRSELMQKYNLQQLDFPLQDSVSGVVVELKFYRRLPNSYFNASQRDRGLTVYYPNVLYQYPTETNAPDIDNLAKFYLDALAGVAYRDDTAVVKLTCAKAWDADPPHNGRTVVKFRDFDATIDNL